ncbi:hypothetical protein ACIQWR_27385 [Streptomyces sp. NPDC098789]|uniref:hypothetical protein n=1 Tax=Streptomyces sp. NPDC098789 TaxID=3366098 RepID=UPI00382CADB7
MAPTTPAPLPLAVDLPLRGGVVEPMGVPDCEFGDCERIERARRAARAVGDKSKVSDCNVVLQIHLSASHAIGVVRCFEL